MSNKIPIDDGVSLDVEALRDMFKPIARVLNLELPPYPQVPIDVEVVHEEDSRHINLKPSQMFVEWRDQVVNIIEKQTRYELGAPSDFKPA